MVTLLGSPTAGESYTLEYYVGDPVVTFEWLGPPDGRTPVTNSSSSLTISSGSSTSQLQFRPLQQSHNGSYSCRATTHEGTIVLSEPVDIQVNGINFTNCTNFQYFFFLSFSSQDIYLFHRQHQRSSSNCRRRLWAFLWYTCRS